MRGAGWLRLPDVHHEHHALLAGLEMRDLPDQLLDLAARGLRVDPGQAGVIPTSGAKAS